MATLKDHIVANDSNSNRVAEAIFLYAGEENKLKINNPRESNRDEYNIKLKLDYYQGIAKEYSRTKNKMEKYSLQFVRREIKKLKAKLNPTLFNRVYYSDVSEALKALFRSKDNPVTHYETAIKKLDKELVQNHNLQFLSSELKKVGFNVEMEGSLKRMINQNLPEFHLRYADVENRNAHYVVHFKKIPETDLYYFEKFDAISRPSLDSLLNGDVNCQRQTFHVHDNLKINAAEAERLVNGKAIFRRVNGNDAWLMRDNLSMRDQLKFVEFDLESKLLKLPIKEKEDANKYQAVIATLKNGKTKEVTLIINDAPVKYMLEAAPDKNEVYVLDKDKVLVDTDKLLTNQQTAKSVWKTVTNQEVNQNHKKRNKVG